MSRVASIPRAVCQCRCRRTTQCAQSNTHEFCPPVLPFTSNPYPLPQRDFAKKKAEFDIQVQTQRAIADMAKDLQTAKTEQRIRNEEMGIRLIERQKQIQVMEQEIERNERHLEATVKEPAKAERYRMETLATATKNKLILEAEARAEAIRAKGDAEAFAINAKAQADADAMAKKAAVRWGVGRKWRRQKDAAGGGGGREREKDKVGGRFEFETNAAGVPYVVSRLDDPFPTPLCTHFRPGRSTRTPPLSTWSFAPCPRWRPKWRRRSTTPGRSP